MVKKAAQLGMNPGTASNRLVKDILFKFVSDAGEVCFQCEMPMTRQNFTIEHKVPWLDSKDPKALYFDLQNIAFSHHKCNVAERRQTLIAICGTNSKYTTGCRCENCKIAHAAYAKSRYTAAGRSARYAKSRK
ncbi:hypothetical protein PSPTOT1_3791 [Pseudomonas syringae pv. tomato T1]|nr:hypothetical protein PSPTOT1_3791 [Pseudomonas syringae pv. tomato T1]RMQ79129.1 hypothetical protein ALQ00_200155 [Pseudomonas syringae pv. tomato]